MVTVEKPVDSVERPVYIGRIGLAATLELVAEESCELGQAALKLARVVRGENPTPVTMAESRENFLEELADVCNVLMDFVPAFWSWEEVRRRIDAKIRRSLSRFQERE